MKTSFKEFLLSNGEERTGAKEGSGVKIFFLFFFLMEEMIVLMLMK